MQKNLGGRYGADNNHLLREKDTWQSREEAQAFFLKAMAGSEGSEQERCATIYTQLCLGMTECRDEVD